jgi:hypothetical protein
MQEINVGWNLPAVRRDGSAVLPGEIAYTEASFSTDGGKTFSTPVQVKPDTTQTVKQKPAPDGNYTFRLVVVGTNGKRGDPFDVTQKVDTPAPGQVTGVTVTVL